MRFVEEQFTIRVSKEAIRDLLLENGFSSYKGWRRWAGSEKNGRVGEGVTRVHSRAWADCEEGLRELPHRCGCTCRERGMESCKACRSQRRRALRPFIDTSQIGADGFKP